MRAGLKETDQWNIIIIAMCDAVDDVYKALGSEFLKNRHRSSHPRPRARQLPRHRYDRMWRRSLSSMIELQIPPYGPCLKDYDPLNTSRGSGGALQFSILFYLSYIEVKQVTRTVSSQLYQPRHGL